MRKPKNQDYFRCPTNTKRVQQWRENNPGYSRRKPDTDENALQDPLTSELSEKTNDTGQFTIDALQDLLTSQPFVILGLIANFTGTALQDDIAISIRHMGKLGQDIANNFTTHCKGGRNDIQIPNSS